MWRVEKSVYNYLHNIKHFTSMSQISATSHHRRLYSKKYNLRPRLHLPKDLRDSLRRSQGCHHSTMTQSDQRSLKKSKDLTLKRCQTTDREPGNRAASVICGENLDTGLDVEVVLSSSDYKAWNFEKKSSTLSEYQRSDIT